MPTIGQYTRRRLLNLIQIQVEASILSNGDVAVCGCPTEPFPEDQEATIPAGHEADLPTHPEKPATADLVFGDVGRGFDYDVTIISTDNTTRKYIAGITGANGDVVSGGIGFLKDRNSKTMAQNLKEAIEHSNGHGTGKITGIVNNKTLTLSQVVSGQNGNTAIRNSVYSINEGESAGFTGGLNGDGHYVLGDLTNKGTAIVTEERETTFGLFSSIKKSDDDLRLANKSTGGDIVLATDGDVTSDADFKPATDEGASLGTADQKWNELHVKTSNVGDLHLHNERGDWTIIEEEDYLTMRNNKTGKRFKILMEPLDE